MHVSYLPTLHLRSLQIPLYLQGNYQQSEGNTRYDGYLQQGIVLSPYSTQTANRFTASHIRVGLPLALGRQWQVIPYAEYGQQRWQRTLTQYQELFTHSSVSVGVLGRYALSPSWLLAVDAAQGRITTTNINIPSLNFLAALGNKPLTRMGVGVDYQWSPQLSVGITSRYSRYGYGASRVINKLQEPESLFHQKMLALQVTYDY